MKIAFLEPLDGLAAELMPQYLHDQDVIVAPAQGQLPEGWQEAEAFVWSRWPVDRSFIESLPRLRYLQRLGRFRAKGDATAAFDRNVPVSILPHGTSGRVAEHTFVLILALFRRLLASHESVLDGRNPANLEPAEQPRGTPGLNWARLPGIQSLHFKTVGIAGFGEIGACLALLLAPFNCRVLYNKRTPLTKAEERFFGVTYASFEDLLAQSDAVADLVPVSEETKAMFGEREFGLMKPSAYFVNTGRAWSMDEAALSRALSEGKIAGAGIDVFSYEPPLPGNPLLQAPNVLLTPHTAGGGGTPERVIGGLGGWMDTFERIRENIRRVEAGEPVLSPMGASDPQPGP